MRPVLMVLTTLLLATTCISSSAAILENEARLQGPTPVDRVIELLTEMQTELSSEAERDAAAYKEMTCWCTNNEQEKTDAIAAADDKISALTSQVEELSATDGRLSAEIEQMKSELEDKKASAKAARALREKEQSAFNGAEIDMVQSVTMLKNAIQILERHAAGLLQVTPAVHESLGSALQWVALKHEEMRSMPQSHSAASSPRKRQSAVAESPLFLQTKADGLGEQLQNALTGHFSTRTALSSDFAARVLQKAVKDSSSGSLVAFAQQPAPYKSYNPRSGQVLGILQQMLEDFETNLSMSQKDELNARATYADLKASLEKEIETIAATLDEKEELHSKNEKDLLDTKQDLEATRSTRAADVTFLSDLRLQCQDLDHDYATRSKARGEELKAVADAIAILTEDEARALFDKKMGAAFVQLASDSLGSSESMALRHAVSRTLLEGADALSLATANGRGREQLASLAVMARLDSFTQVKEAMDRMIEDLKAQQAEEVEHKETCLKELNSNEKSTYTTKREHGKAVQKSEALGLAITQLEDDIAAANEEMGKMKLQLKEESEARKAENERFQEEMTDQRAIQNILSKAIARLRQVYKNGEEAFAQQEPVSPKKFQPYAQSSAAGPVISMLEQIVGDASTVEKDELAAEQAAQKSYASMVADVTASVKQMEQTVEIKTKTKAATKVEEEDAKTLASSLQGRLEDLAAVSEDLHTQCDYFLKNFDVRQKARLQEIEAIQSAKAYLNGMKAEPAATKQ